MNGDAEKIAELRLQLKTLEERQDSAKIEIRYELEISGVKKIEASKTVLKEVTPPVSAAALLVDVLVGLRNEIEFYLAQAQEHGLPPYKKPEDPAP